MKTLPCPKCGTEVPYMTNRKRLHVGMCATCGKMVTLGKAGNPETEGGATEEETGTARRIDDKKAAEKAARASTTPTPSGTPDGGGVRTGGGFLDRIFAFLAELDAPE